MDRLENFKFAKEWAVKHRRANISRAASFASWYADEYPAGDKNLSEAWSYWIVEVCG